MSMINLLPKAASIKLRKEEKNKKFVVHYPPKKIKITLKFKEYPLV